MEKYFDVLMKISLFAGINPADLSQLLSNLGATAKNYKKDEFIKLAGDSADFIGIVLAGNIQILQDDFYGNRNITTALGPGAIFAEAFACAGIASLPVAILSCTDTTILFINSRNLFNSEDYKLGADGCECPPKECECGARNILMNNLLRIVAKKNIFLNQKLRYLSHKTTCEKIMAYLNDMAIQNHSPEFRIPFDRQALADYLGVERSAMSAEIGKLVKQGYIETNRSYFKLLDRN